MDGLGTVEYSGLTASGEKNLLRGDLKFITFRVSHCRIYSKDNGVTALLFIGHTDFGSGHLFYKGSQKIGSTMHFFISCRIDDRSTVVDNKRCSVLGKDNLLRLRNYVQIPLFDNCGATGTE